MATTPFPNRIGFNQVCVAPAILLSEETDEDEPSSLYSEASYEGLCYLRVTRSFGDGMYIVRVASSPQLVQTQGFTVVLSEEQLSSAIPWDCRTSPRLHNLRSTQKALQEVTIEAIAVMPKAKEQRTINIPATCAP